MKKIIGLGALLAALFVSAISVAATPRDACPPGTSDTIYCTSNAEADNAAAVNLTPAYNEVIKLSITSLLNNKKIVVPVTAPGSGTVTLLLIHVSKPTSTRSLLAALPKTVNPLVSGGATTFASAGRGTVTMKPVRSKANIALLKKLKKTKGKHTFVLVSSFTPTGGVPGLDAVKAGIKNG
jgi:hypothetical protein